MLSISYDSTFNGFLSVVFEIYRQHLDVGEIHPDRSDSPCNLFMQPFRIETSEESAQRLKRAISNQARLRSRLPFARSVRNLRREVGGMLGMVRFNRMPDGTYFSEIEPKYDILELLIGHFRGRFANERWVINDSKRGFGVYYDGKNPVEMSIPNIRQVSAMNSSDNFVQLWQDYYKSIAIKERENPKLMKQCLPVRYWKHLPERQVQAKWA